MRVPAAIATTPFATIHPPNTAGQRGINTQLDFGLQSISAFAKPPSITQHTFRAFKDGGREVIKQRKRMSSKENAYRRISGFGKLIAECHTQALHYGSCVSQKENITKHACDKEFHVLKACIKQAARKTKM